MRIEQDYKIENSVSKDESRPHLHNAFLDLSDEKQPVLVATDGKQMAVVPVDKEEGDTQGFVTPEILKEARKPVHRFKDSIHADGTLSVDGISMPRPSSDDLTFPNWRMVYKAKEPVKGEITLGISPKLLMSLAKSLNAEESITLVIRPNQKGEVLDAIFVKGNGADGVIMPMRVATLEA